MARYVISQSLRSVAEHQRGILTRAQLAQDGLPAAGLRRRLVADWRLVLPGVVSLGSHPLTHEQRLVAAVLMAGPDGALTGAAATRAFGVTNTPASAQRIDVLVPDNHASRSAGFVRVVRTRRMPVAPRHDGPLVFAPPARAIADLCRQLHDERVARAVVIEAVQRRTTTLAELQHELYAGPRRGSALLRRAVEAAATGAWSAPEHDLLLLLARSRQLPHPWPNPRLATTSGQRLPSPDVWFDDVGMAVQVHSRRHHGDGEDWDRTVRQDSALAEAGVLRLSVTPREIAVAPGDVLSRIERLHASRRPADRPGVVMTPRQPGLA